MKTLQIARGIAAVLSLAGVTGLVGCGAETGEQGAQIGSTEQALSASEVDSSGPTLSTGVAYQGACKVTVSGEDYILQIGGKKASTPTYSDDVQVIRVSNNTVTNFTGVLNVPIAFFQAVTKPGDSSKCLLVGGEQTGSPTHSETAIDQLTLTVDGSKVPTGVTVSSSGTLSTGRSFFQVLPCGTSSLLIAGGKDGSTTSALDSMEVWAAGTVSAFKDASNNTVKMSSARREFAMAQADSTHLVIGGGVNSGGTQLTAVDRVIVDSSCKLTSTLSSPFTLPNLGASKTLSQARQGLVAFQTAHNANDDHFFFVAGDNSGTAQSTVDEITVNWGTPASDNSAAVTSASVATKAPTLAIIGLGHAFLLGGPSVNAMQEYDSGWTSVTTDKNSSTLANRDGATAIVANSKLYVSGGFDATNYLTSTLLVTP